MSDNAAWIALFIAIAFSMSTCTISNTWKNVQMEKIKLEREKLGPVK